MAGFVVFDDATVRIYPMRSADMGERMPSGAGSPRREKRGTGLSRGSIRLHPAISIDVG